MQNESPNGMTIKDVIVNQHNQISQLNDKIVELEKKMAVIEQKTIVEENAIREGESILKDHTKRLDSLSGMGILLMAGTGIFISVAIFAGQAWVQLAIVQHEKTTIHYKDYFKYPEPNQHPK